MREADLLEDLDLAPGAVAVGGGGPLADAVHGEDRGLLEGRVEEGARGVRAVVLAEEEGPVPAQALTDRELRSPRAPAR